MNAYKIISFNVNSVRRRLEHIKQIIKKHSPLIIGLQETKVQDHEFPLQEINNMGYAAEFFGQKTHYGVATMYDQKTVTLIKAQKGFATDTEIANKRFIATTFKLPNNEDLTIVNGYFPQGENENHPIKFPAKRKFYQDLNQWLTNNKNLNKENLIVLGDFNIAPEDNDIGIGEQNKKRWLQTGKTSFLPEERQWWQNLTSLGLQDSFRLVHPSENQLFSWFDFRSRGFEANPKRGLRIDTLLVTKPLSYKIKNAGIDYDIRSMTSPSDHAPVWSEFSLS